jgi:hypothetical protein
VSLEEALQRWDEALDRIGKLMLNVGESDIELTVEMKNLLWHTNDLNNTILQELERAKSTFQGCLDYIQNENNMIGK